MWRQTNVWQRQLATILDKITSNNDNWRFFLDQVMSSNDK